MNAKIDRVNKDIEKTKEKIAEFQARLREQEQRKWELENTEIVDIVRGLDISLSDLAGLLKGLPPATATIADQVGPKSGGAPADTTDTDTDTDNEEMED